MKKLIRAFFHKHKFNFIKGMGNVTSAIVHEKCECGYERMVFHFGNFKIIEKV